MTNLEAWIGLATQGAEDLAGGDGAEAQKRVSRCNEAWREWI